MSRPMPKPKPGTSRRNFLRRALGAIAAAPALPAIAGAVPAVAAVPAGFTDMTVWTSAWTFYPALVSDEAIERLANLMCHYYTVDCADEARGGAWADSPWRDLDAD